LRHLGALRGFMHVGQHRQAKRGSDLREDRQRLRKAKPARGGRAGAVGLVEGGLVDETYLQPRGDLLQGGGHLQRVLTAFELAGSGNDRDRQIIAELDRANGDDRRR